jgi:hypothetical protein
VTSSPSPVEKCTPRDPISPFMIFYHASVRAMYTLALLFMLLDHASIQAMLNLVLEFVMIYILILIWKLPNYLISFRETKSRERETKKRRTLTQWKQKRKR